MNNITINFSHFFLYHKNFYTKMNQYFQSNSTVLFQGNSITEWGRSETPIGTGYLGKTKAIYTFAGG